MKIVRFTDKDGNERLGTNYVNGRAELLSGELFGELRTTGRIAEVEALLAPLSPPNIFGIGLNYGEHVRQSGAQMPAYPVTFLKPTTSIAHPGEPILIPKCCEDALEVDYECELAVVIGRTARDVSEGDALDYVFGYTAANEITARRWAKVSRARGKSFDRFCPLGPALVTADEVPDPQALRLSTTLNGTVVQDSSTADMLFPVATLISYLSQDTTLLPGTVILTGTPPGTGQSREPPLYLKPGDSVQVEVEKVGVLSNPVEAKTRVSVAA